MRPQLPTNARGLCRKNKINQCYPPPGWAVFYGTFCYVLDGVICLVIECLNNAAKFQQILSDSFAFYLIPSQGLMYLSNAVDHMQTYVCCD